MTDSNKDITVLLKDWESGNESAMEQLMAVVYDELRKISRSYLSNERSDHTLGATGLVNEAYFRLVNQNRTSWQSRAHFFGVAAQVMRRILINHARDKKAAKRGGGAVVLNIDQITDMAEQEGIDLEALEEALNGLASFDERQAKIVELKFYGGLTEEEMSEVLKVSPATIRRDWRRARLWLLRFLKSNN